MHTDAELDALVSKYGMIREELRQQRKLGNQRITQGIALVGLLLGYTAYADSPELLILLPLVASLVIAFVTTAINEFLLLSLKALRLEERIEVAGFDYETKYGPLNGENQFARLSVWYTVPWVVLLVLAVCIYLLSVAAPLIVPEIRRQLSHSAALSLGVGYVVLSVLTALSLVSFVQISRRILKQSNGSDGGRFGVLSELLSAD